MIWLTIWLLLSLVFGTLVMAMCRVSAAADLRAEKHWEQMHAAQQEECNE